MRVANSTTRRMIAAVALLSIAVLPAAFGEEAPSVPSRPRALAAPTGFNAIDVGGQSKDFLKLPGGYRDGFQKVIFEEVGPANQPALPDAPSADHFGAYDDNSVVADNQEEPLFIPLPYRNETAAEKADRLRKEEEEKQAKRERLRTSTLPPAPTRAPFQPTRNIVSPVVANRPPITIRPPPAPQTFQPQQPQRPFQPSPPAPVQQPQQFRPPFVAPPPQQPARPFQPPPPTQQPPFAPQRPQGFTPFPPRQPPAAPATFRPPPPPPPAPQAARPTQPPPPFVNRPNLPAIPAVQRPPVPQAPPQAPPRPFNPAPAPVQRPFNPPPPPPAPTTPRAPPPPPPAATTLRPPSAPFRPLRPFRPPTNNFVLPTPQTAPPPPPPTAAPRAPLGGLRTGVCARTIYYKPQEASATEIAQVYSHFAVVVSVDQCARTCHEFNCAQALFDPTNRHCQFNPGTIRSQPQSCEAWPNPLYRNNVPITSRPLLLRCVTCQARRRNPLRPFQRQNARAFGLAQSLSESPIQRSTLARRIHGVMIKENITRTTDVERLLRKSAEAEKIVQMGGGGSAEAPSIALLPERPSVDAMTDDEKPPQSEAAPLADAPEAPRKNVHTTDLEIKPADGPKSAEQPKERADAPVDSGTDEQTAGFLVATLPKGGGVRVHRLDQRRLEDDAGSD